jgi:hypothetical protein
MKPVKFCFQSCQSTIRAIHAIPEENSESGSRRIAGVAANSNPANQQSKNTQIHSSARYTRDAETGELEKQPRIARIAKIAASDHENEKKLFVDDRHYCLDCQSLKNGHCKTHKFKPLDDIPRRCVDFQQYNNQATAIQTADEDKLTAIKKWLSFIGEDDPQIFNDALNRCQRDPKAMEYFFKRSNEIF